MSKILPQETDEKPPSTMRAAHITEWCDVGTVADSIVLGEVPAPPPPVKREVVIGVRATAINVDDVAGLQDTAMGGVCVHLPGAEGGPAAGGRLRVRRGRPRRRAGLQEAEGTTHMRCPQ